MNRLYLFCARLSVAGLFSTLLTCPLAALATEPPPPDKIILFPPGAGAPVRVRATEDTLPENRVFEMPEVKVQEVRVPLIEIIRKAQAGERRKYEGIHTMAFTRTTKVTMKFTGRKPETRCLEKIGRIYFRTPDQWSEAPLRTTRYKFGPDGERKPWDPDDESDDVSVRDGRSLSELPYYLDRLDKFSFRIVERQYDNNQVLYKIAFEPKSDFATLPGGTMWLLTNGYQIVHEEFHLKNLPVPWILKSLGLLTREWQSVEGHWVEKRITAKAELGMNFLGVPREVEIVVQNDDYKFDLPLDERLFRGDGR